MGYPLINVPIIAPLFIGYEELNNDEKYLCDEEDMKQLFVCVMAVLISFCFFGTLMVTAQGDDQTLVQQYAPILYFEHGETCYPVDVSFHLENSYVYAIGNETPDDMDIEEFDLLEYASDTYYLDNQLGGIDDTGIIDAYQTAMSSLGYTIYGRVYDTGVSMVIQYWMFYAFNSGEQNQHEGDWEMVQVVFSSGEPSQVMYSQHHIGQRASWGQVEKQGDHIKVYVSRGSHANYLRSYSGMVGVASDIVGANGKIWTSDEYNLVLLDTQPWLEFPGRWGWAGTTDEQAIEASILGQSGPFGPKYREDGLMWDNPTGWGTSLLAADNTVFLLEWILYHFILLFIVISAISVAVLCYRIYRRHKTTGLGPRIVSILYIDGTDSKSIGNILCIVGIIVALIALFLPWYVITTDIGVAGYETKGMANMMTIDGINGVQIQIPGLTGPMPMGSIILPFSLFIAIGLVFMILTTIGIAHSKKLGRKYLARGVRLFLPVFFIIIALLMLGMIPFESMVETGSAYVDVGEIFSAISSSPSGGNTLVSIPEVGGEITFQWGFGLGGILLVVAGICMVIAGALEIMTNIELYPSKQPGDADDEPPAVYAKKPSDVDTDSQSTESKSTPPKKP